MTGHARADAELQLLTSEEVAQKLGISTKTLMAHVRAGDIEFVSIGTGEQRIRRRFSPVQVEAFIQSRRMRSLPAARPAPTGNTVPALTAIRFTDLQRPPSKRQRQTAM